MKIFLCWSGERSKLLAQALQEWLIATIPGVKKGDIFFSPNIAKGSKWFEEVRARLTNANAAVICLTPENVQSPWMHFEAGAVLGHMGRECVFPYLFKVRPADLQGPLGEFQVTVNNEEDTRRLAADLCKMAKGKLSSRYGNQWKKLEAKMNELKVERVSDIIQNFAELFQRKTFDEPLKECTHQTWGDRYTGARETHKTLSGNKALVARVCEPSQLELYNRLVSIVDGYAGMLKGFLLEERRFSFAADGAVDFTKTVEGEACLAGAAIAPAAERRMKQIKRLVHLLDSPAAAAVLGESVAFSRLTVHAERKEIVRAKRYEIESKRLKLTREQLKRCQESIWDLDRIAYYGTLEFAEKPPFKELSEAVEGEIERLRAGEEGASAMPLHYALRALLNTQVTDNRGRLLLLIEEVESYIEESGRDAGGQIRANLRKLRQAAVSTQA